jgi:hypothetical protein
MGRNIGTLGSTQFYKPKRGTKEEKRQWSATDWFNHGYVESDLQTFLIAEFKTMHEVYVIKVKQANEVGVPDLLLCVGGRFVGMELKRHRGQATPQQTKHIWSIQEAGGVAGIVKCYSDAMALIKEAKDNEKQSCI